MKKQEEKKLQEKEEILNSQEIENIEGGSAIDDPESENPDDSEGFNIGCINAACK